MMGSCRVVGPVPPRASAVPRRDRNRLPARFSIMFDMKSLVIMKEVFFVI